MQWGGLTAATCEERGRSFVHLPLDSTMMTLLLLVAALADDVTWTRRQVASYPVSVELPGVSKVRHSERAMWVGTILSDTVVAEWENGWAAATVTRIPPFASSVASEANIFHTTRKSVLDEAKATDAVMVEIKRGSLVGRRLTYSSHKSGVQQGETEIFTWGDTVATFTTVYDPAATPEGTAAHFFRSIRIEPKP